MNWRMVYFGLAGTMMCTAGLQAATLIEHVESEGGTMKIWFQGAKMRMDTEEGAYMLMDWETNKMYIVSPEEGMAMDMSHIMAAKSKGGGGDSKPKAEVSKVGDGPEIAGYDTVHYRITVEGTHCQDIYASKKAYKDLDADDLFERMQKLSDTDMEGMDEWSTSCDYADQGLDFAELGFPMRTEYVESGGWDEVKNIVPDAGQPDGGFDVPAGLEVMDMSQMMQYMQRPPGNQ
jgi:hypothetical protein